MIETQLAPGLLLAMPQLNDPNFERAVVLMVQHDEDGSFGLIINRPLDFTTAQVCGTMDIEWNGEKSSPVWAGGPVTPNSGWVLHEPVESLIDETATLTSGGTLSVAPGISLSTSPNTLRFLAKSPPERVRFILGYSGWGAGQLAREVKQGAWLHAEASPELVFDTPAADIWRHALRSVGIDDPESIIPGRGVH